MKTITICPECSIIHFEGKKLTDKKEITELINSLNYVFIENVDVVNVTCPQCKKPKEVITVKVPYQTNSPRYHSFKIK
jgi:hypothetical protein